jgi:hypothetical protein
VNCAALLEDGQDWCLECGTAQPGRLGSKPGWRPALVVVAITTLLVAGAVAAAYAALTSDAERTASAPPPASAQPVTPPAPAPVEATPAPTDETPSVPAPKSDPAPKADSGSSSTDSGTSGSSGSSGSVDTSGDSFDSGSTDSGTTGSTGSSGTTDTEDEGNTTPKPKPSPIIALSPGAASTFDPHDRAGGLTGDPADAIDGKRATAWEAPVNADGKVDIGLLVSLDKAQAIEKVRVLAGTPGFTVELYGSKLGTAPDAAPGATKYWTKLDDTRDFGTDEKLNAGGGTYRHLLLWFTDQPADTKVMIPEVTPLKDPS